MAKEVLALKKAEFTNKSLVLNGRVKTTQTSGIVPAGAGLERTNSMSVQASAAIDAKQFSLSGGVNGTYNFDTGSFSPSLSVSGSWNNNKTLASDALTLQKLENEVLIAELAYQTALNEYLQNAATLESNIAAWKMTHALHRQSMDYNLALLKQQQTLFEKGLATKADVDDAAFNVEIDAYTLSSILLDGLKLENQIRALQI
ncbi:MAG: TolC family protein [Sphaerochaeta sp.]|nr:TolC family protein [Sphaerochaeta sp.]